ncbi:MAG: hypothetical protein M3Y42_19045 [Actinomycetota bacterium]|nr:hypothetical protein [Actinomycetota bacterium]MDQ2959042.1 hypothetical protein [Actinomycetota bacterium]
MAVFAAAGFAAATSGSALAAPQTTHATATPAAAQHQTERLCSTPAKGHMACMAIKQVSPSEPATIKPNSVSPNATPSGYGPSSLQSAYALPSSTAGSGQTVGIVDAQDDPNAESDLAAYRTQFGLPACTTANGCFKKVNQSGASSPLPTADTGWAGEISLDVDMVSAVCPNCHILLVEASSATTANLGTAVNTAVSLGAKFVSNSYGGSEDGSENTYDSSYFHHPGVAITASSGDSDYDGGSYPATSKYVTAVGGTSLNTASNSRGWTEKVWNTTSYTEGTGSGCSSDIAKPAFQTSISTGCANRAEADVSAVADPATGLAVYQTYGGSGWAVYGGTSAASPIVASVYALAGTPGASDTPNAYPYAHTANLNDVTSGSNGTCGAPLCTAGTGWDGPTGLGTPNGVAAFTAGGGGGGTGVTVANPGSKTGTVGTAVSLQLSASGGTAPYTWTATGLPNGLSISTTGLISGTPTTAGSFSVTATAKDATNATGSTTFGWTISTSGGGGGCSSPGQKLGNPGFETGTAAPWSASTGVIDNSSGEAAHSGSWKAWLDGYGTTHTDTLSQSVTIPAGCTATFSFYLHIDTAETGTTAYDKLTVKAGSTTLATYSNLNKNTGYALKSFTLTAGQTVSISFSGVEDSSLQTSFVIDDTAVTVS